MLNAFNFIIDCGRNLILFTTLLTILAVSFSCAAQKKSAIRQLIIQKPTENTIKKVEEEKFKQNEIKSKMEAEENEKKRKSASLAKEENRRDKSRVDVTEKIETKKQRIVETLSATSKTEIKSLPPVQKIPEPAVPKNIQDEKEVSLNFESTDIKDIIVTFCELLKIDYILDPNISGKITLQTFQKVKINDLFRILEKILFLNNLTVMKSGNFYRFMPVEKAKKESLNIFFGKNSDGVPSRDRFIIQIVPLRYVSAGSVKGVVTPLLSSSASFLNVPDTNNLVIIDTANNIKKLLSIIELIDVKEVDDLQVKLYPMEHSDAIEMALELQEIFDSLGHVVVDKKTPLKFLPVERLNSLLVINPFSELLPNIEFWISKLDIPSFEGLEKKTYVYYVQNTTAGDLAALLNQLYNQSSNGEILDKNKKRSRGEKHVRTAAGKKIKTKKEGKTRKDTSLSVQVKSFLPEEFAGEINIVPDEFTNSLIIQTLPKNYPVVLETIKQLDLMPLQVLIEVLVLELTIDEQTRAGLDWAFKSSQGKFAVGSVPASQSISVGASTVGATLGGSATALLGQGFSIIAQTDNISSLFQAFAQDSKIEVLSNPILITSENMPASINITDDIPIETTRITTPTAGQPLTESTIQYKSVGILLQVTPKINRDRFVTLEISQEVSNVNEAAAFSQPAFFSRNTKTTVVVKDNQSLVIGGLMSKTKSHSDSGIPFLKDIPVFGRLFKSASDRVRKTELMIFITPHVIANVTEADDITKKFQSKLLLLKPTRALKR